MSFQRALILVALLGASAVQAQQGGQPAAPAARDVEPVKLPAVPEWRRTDNYRFPAIGRTVADMQNLAYAMQLRDYCADRRVSDDFVREQLTRFGRLTGRDETCASLMDY
ncbi:hypothetical protein [Thauera sp. 63]|uniref:hypothetical protein n=1 Tax=Thauera sp. 63 TaxID=497321 RepID=UPI0002CF0969|nr:hypothetical protein [Thauera sp. 63]ENO77913.1 hypothetical protein C664_10283 [Thauera sp. 63]